MAGETPESSSEGRIDRLEGMLIAHRQVLAQMIALVNDNQLADRLEDRAVLRDGQEDPGAVPTDGVATGLAIAEEVSRLLSLARVARQPAPDEDVG
ncbi:hypothetical protein [Falsirhodobacter deserti]|uniref:hypothetical protein n=1 Tax=Falsirhodobacter deserti TaxID=1365611 RepID=UPI0019D4B3C9|nr:hypothetical protein [Falsirhodobacter deserti]